LKRSAGLLAVRKSLITDLSQWFCEEQGLMTDESDVKPWARLILTIGERNRSYPLTGERAIIGRGADCDIRLRGRSVSRHHCLLTRREGGGFIEDLKSTNGTCVGEVKIDSKPLTDGDLIRVGHYLFEFRLSDSNDLANADVIIDQSNDGELYIPENTITLNPEFSSLLVAGDISRIDATPARLTRNLQVLLSIALDINSYQSIDVLYHNLLQSVLDVVPATHAMLVSRHDGQIAARSADGYEQQGVRPSTTVIDYVLKNRISLLSNEIPELEIYSISNSLGASNTASILAVPLFTPEQTLGLIYLVSVDPLNRFDKSHLDMVSAISVIVSPAIDRLRRLNWLEAENRRLADASVSANGMIGKSQKILAVQRFIAKVAPLPTTVMIYGETGTGKELLARAIHANSPRASKPLVSVNSAGLVESLLESELFGHEKGAFTGADFQKKGKLEIADGGTLFFDEVGDMPLSIQVKLLRVLQERTFERLGGLRSINTDIRIIAATNRNLEAAVAQNLFRADLFFRLNVVSITLPSLRERESDIELLAIHFTRTYAERYGRSIAGITPEALAALNSFSWPGNVRELQNVIEEAMVFCSSDHLRLEDLPDRVRRGDSGKKRESITVPLNPHPRGIKPSEIGREAKRQKILNSIELAGGNITTAAKLLDIHPPNLHRLIRRLGLRQDVERIVGRNGDTA